MSKYINTDVLKEAMLKYGFRSSDQTVTEFVEDTLPTADVRENKHGEWIRHYDEDGDADGYSCSACSEWYYFGNTTPNFCPNCGADMRKYLKHADNDTARGGLASAT